MLQLETLMEEVLCTLSHSALYNILRGTPLVAQEAILESTEAKAILKDIGILCFQFSHIFIVCTGILQVIHYIFDFVICFNWKRLPILCVFLEVEEMQ